MIKSIFFDFDGVLTTDPHGSYSTARFLEEKLKVSKQKIMDCYRDVFVGFRISNKKYSDYIDKFSYCLEKNVEIDVLFNAFLSTPKNEEMFELVNELKKNYKIGIITVNTKERFDTIAKEWSLYELFNTIVLSADVGCKKDNILMFEKAMDSFKIQPEECVFIDNTKKNLEIPKEIGMKIIYHDDALNDIDKLKDKLKVFGVNI